MPVLERNIEQPVVRFAKDRGCLVRKMNGLGQIGWPDRMFVAPNGTHLYIEFKKPGGEPTELQKAFHKVMRAHRMWVEVIDDVKAGKKLIGKLLRGK